MSRLETVQESLSERYDRAVGQFSVALGQLGKAKERFGRLPEARRPLFLAALADALDDQRSLREHMTARLARNPTYLALQVRAGLSPDPVALEAEPQGHQQIVAGIIAFRQGKWSDAIASLEPGIEWARSRILYRKTFYLASESLATAYSRTGDEVRAMNVLEKAAEESPLLGFGGQIMGVHAWYRVQAGLARGYRKLGRTDEAVTVEDELLHRLKYADADHPIVLQIREARSATSSETAAQ